MPVDVPIRTSCLEDAPTEFRMHTIYPLVLRGGLYLQGGYALVNDWCQEGPRDILYLDLGGEQN